MITVSSDSLPSICTLLIHCWVAVEVSPTLLQETRGVSPTLLVQETGSTRAVVSAVSTKMLPIGLSCVLRTSSRPLLQPKFVDFVTGRAIRQASARLYTLLQALLQWCRVSGVTPTVV